MTIDTSRQVSQCFFHISHRRKLACSEADLGQGTNPENHLQVRGGAGRFSKFGDDRNSRLGPFLVHHPSLVATCCLGTHARVRTHHIREKERALGYLQLACVIMCQHMSKLYGDDEIIVHTMYIPMYVHHSNCKFYPVRRISRKTALIFWTKWAHPHGESSNGSTFIGLTVNLPGDIDLPWPQSLYAFNVSLMDING